MVSLHSLIIPISQFLLRIAASIRRDAVIRKACILLTLWILSLRISCLKYQAPLVWKSRIQRMIQLMLWKILFVMNMHWKQLLRAIVLATCVELLITKMQICNTARILVESGSERNWHLRMRLLKRNSLIRIIGIYLLNKNHNGAVRHIALSASDLVLTLSVFSQCF